MRFVVVGAGAIGGTIGGRLHESGHDVVLIARGRHLEAIREHGLRLRTPEGEQRLAVPVAAGPEEVELDEGDVLVAAVKSQDTEGLLTDWGDAPLRMSESTAGERLPIVMAQNGVTNEAAALRHFRRVYAVSLWMPATFLEPGVVIADGSPNTGYLIIGRVPGAVDEVTTALARAAAASRFVAAEDATVMRWKYGKLLSNLANGLEALVGQDDSAGDLAMELRREGEAVLEAAGIDFAKPDEERRRRGDAVRGRRWGSSTWQSFARGAASNEVDYLNGEIVRLGRLHGVPTPVNESIQRLARRASRERREPGHLSVAALRAIIRGAVAPS
jgi:2-dehydropantoate 2-reductase